jgi:hypothetical protein
MHEPAELPVGHYGLIRRTQAGTKFDSHHESSQVQSGAYEEEESDLDYDKAGLTGIAQSSSSS